MARRHRIVARATRKVAGCGIRGAKVAANVALLVGFWSVMAPAMLYSMYTYDPSKRREEVY